MTVNDSPDYPIRDAFRRFFPIYQMLQSPLPPEVKKTANCIMRCKTGELGYNISKCESCGHYSIHAVSCNNRSCPCCQAHFAKKWEEERNTELIEGISYYHVVFTVPHELNILFRTNRILLLNLLFRCVNETLLTLCADSKFMGAKPGIISVLHTWGQTLSFHPHLHVCISGGGITPSGQFIETRHKGFFIPEAVIASMFRGKFLSALKTLHQKGDLDLSRTICLHDPALWKQYIDSLYVKKWLPFVKETFNGKGNAIRYLARYSYRTAIANSRILSVDENTVSFRYKDYADNGKEKEITLKGTTFIKMFLQHVLPASFHRFRMSGYLCNSKKSKNLKLIHKLRNTSYRPNPYRKMKAAELIHALYGIDPSVCPVCSGKMIWLPRGTPVPDMPSFENISPISMS